MSLVALCFVAVLSMVLASYIAVCSRAMNLSNRTYQKALSRQLAELGLEEGLRAFNNGDWGNWLNIPTGMTSGAAWSIDSSNKRATRTIAFTSGKLGQGMTATIKIRIDNYDANVLGNATWSSSRSYGVNDLVDYSGIWYRSVKGSNIGKVPTTNLDYWASETMPWAWCSNKSYRQNIDLVCYSGTWYRCIGDHLSTTTFDATQWSATTAPQMVMTAGTTYSLNQYVYRTSDNTWYRCLNPHIYVIFISGNWEAVSGSSASTSYPPWAYRTSGTYSFNDVVYHNQVWYRYINATPSSTTPPTASHWENALSGMSGWSSSGIKYSLGDAVYYTSNSRWYRCIRPNTSSGTLTPSDTTYWATTPFYSTVWELGRSYAAGDLVRYNGLWYRCLQGTNTVFPTNSSYWASPVDSYFGWSPTAFGAGSMTRYGGVWYTCVAANTGESPNNTTYWTATRWNSAGVSTGATVIYAESTIAIAGGRAVQTQLRALVQPASLFPNALGATNPISLGSGGAIDSYDSTTDLYAATRGYSAVLASTYNVSTAVTVFGTTIQGYVAAPPGTSAPLASFGSNAVVKGTAATPSPKADLARLSRSPFVPQFDTWPSGGLSANWSTSPKGTALAMSSIINLGTPGATTPSRYYCTSLTIDGSPVTTVNISGPVILYIQGNLTVGGATNNSANKIMISSTGSAEIHVGGNLNINANGGGIDNLATKDPRKLILICDSSGAGLQTYSDGDNDFYGVIYAPNTGNIDGFLVSNSSTEIFGAVSAKKITYSNNANVHYDTSLRNATIPGVDQPYAVTELRELPQTEAATMP